ncbi:MAG: hypothetical protein IPK52_08905 [Chloroflexi bacterium]|nr:hypothetical protein [Chloroflexota bacterium]
MSTSHPNQTNEKTVREQGQAIIEYALILVLVGVAFGLALAASAPVTGNLFNAVVNDLLRQTVVGDVPNPEEFWGTVTEVYRFTPASGALPTNTPAAPTEVPTDGPSPTPSNTYTPSPVAPTRTPTLTPTYGDDYKDAPFVDTVDEPRWWRIDSNIALGGVPWTGNFYPNTTFSGAPTQTINGIWALDYNGPFIANWPPANPGDNFSAKFTRTIELPADRTLNFRLLADDGVRMFVDGTPVTLTDASGNTNSFQPQPATLYTGAMTLTAGTHTILVDYFEQGGDSVLKVEILGAGGNPDDGSIDNGGNPATNVYSCGWGAVNDEGESNTERKLFDDYVGGENIAGTLCYLEWRGAVNMPSDSSNMQLTFWDVWEFDAAGIDGWLEVAEYIPVNAVAFPPTANRAAMTWQKVDLARAGTANFNWTRTVVDLAPLMSGWTSNKLAFRFVMQVPAGTSADRQWFIDDIEFKNKTEQIFPVDQVWTLNDADERFDFIRTGGISNPGEKSGWGLVSNNKFGPSGLAFHDSADDANDSPTQIAGTNGSPYTYYKRLEASPISNFLTDVRVHALEFDGWVDLATAPATDSLGNTGGKVLSFYHAYDLGTRTGLYIQYSVTPYNVSPAVWTTFTDGLLRPVTDTGTVQSLTLQEQIVSLDGIVGNPARIRIRFAMMVHKQAALRDGWWIDQIRLGRAESNKWLNYPFSDDAQLLGPLYNWRYTGSWAATSTLGHRRVDASPGDVELSYASSPASNYTDGMVSYMTMRWPIDLYNDTPSKTVMLEAGGATGTSNTFGGPAIDPNLTFFHWRNLAGNDNFEVQWKRASEPDSSYRILWLYRYAMGGSATTAINLAWEPVRVSLYPIYKQFTADGNGAPGVGTGTGLTDDDILIRFVLRADGSSNAPGIFVDDIRLEENTMRTVRLWPSNQNRVDPTTSVALGTGTGSFFFSEPDGSLDGRRYENDWKLGGEWSAVSYEKRDGSGSFSFHDSSVGGQDRAPTGLRMLPSNTDDFGDTAWVTAQQSYNVLELDRVFDLRGVFAEDEAPVLNFWTRYHIGEDEAIRVQISVKDTSSASTIDAGMPARCASQPVLQCYEQERGWSAWQTNYPSTSNPIWTVTNSSAPSLSYGWRKISVNLAPFAYSPLSPTTPGKQIRIRFLYDAYDSNDTNFDGWYVDGVEVAYRLPAPTTTILSSVFSDTATSMANWIGEGKWALDQNIFIGGAGTPVSLGLWSGRWWNCPWGGAINCWQLGQDAGASGDRRFGVGAGIFLSTFPRATPHRTAVYSTINLNYGGGSPVAGWSPTNDLVAEFTVDIAVDGLSFQPGARSFTTRSDDAVRFKIEELDAGGVPIPNSPIEWNIINNWTDHSATTDQGVTPAGLSFLLGRRYRLTLQHYDRTGSGLIQLTASDGKYSFSDSPKFTGGATPDEPAIPYANTSLLGRHLLDLTGFGAGNYPVMEIQTKYRLHSNSEARVEVSSDGGFTWRQTGMDTDVGAIDAVSPNFDGETGLTNPDTDAWQVRLFNLNSFEGSYVLLRMRLDRISTYCWTRNDCDNSDVVGWNGDGVGGNPSLPLKDGYYDGWWVAVVRVMALP